MIKYAVALAVLGFVGVSAPSPQGTACLHGPSETPAQKARLQAAVGFVRAVNTAELSGYLGAQSYYTLGDIPGLPPVPEGFKARLSTDGSSYAMSVKDTTDPCHFAFFSDQEGLIYSATPIR